MDVRPFAASAVAALLAFAAASDSSPARQQPSGESTPPAAASGQPGAGGAPIALQVDATRAVQGILFVHETIPVRPGPLTLVYPKWIPGAHAPVGPIQNVAGLVVRANGAVLPWTRDPVELFSFHVDVPAGTSSLDVAFEYLGAQAGAGGSGGRLSSPTILSLEWNSVVLTPFAQSSASVMLSPSIRLPSPQWAYATALESASHDGADVAFKPVSLEMLVDSPLDAGLASRTFALGTWDGAPVTLAAFADAPRQLAASDKTQEKLRNLVAQMHALYRNRHWNHYTFLLTVSSVLGGEGLEHHQSSDNGTGGDFLTDETALTASADLLAHEFNHSWDGKFRRPYDLATPNLQVPMIDDLLWVYEGMTQFYGNLQAERAGLRTEQQWLDSLAMLYAQYDTERGRLTRPLVDTATSSSFLYGARGPWMSERRSVDYYSEGELLWLEADVRIRTLSGGKRSLDDVARAFFGHGEDTGPQVLTYTRADVIAALNAVAPYDWTGFLAARVDAIAPHPPDFLTGGGYRLTYTDTPSAYERLSNGRRRTIDLRYSVGLVVGRDGTVADVLPDSVAYRAGVGPGDKIVAVDDRALAGQEQLDAALRAAKGGTPMRLLLSGGEVYRTVVLPYTRGPRYPHLERVAGTPDVLDAIARPLATVP